MNEEKLKKLPSLRREISRTKRRIANCVRQAEAARGDAALEAAISAERALLESYILQAKKEEAELISYIQSIDDGYIRELFMLRYFDGIRSWQRIAFLAGEHDESYVRRKHNSYLRKQNNNCHSEQSEESF